MKKHWKQSGFLPSPSCFSPHALLFVSVNFVFCFYGTGQILFQKADSKAKTLEKFKITRSNKTKMKYQYNPFIHSILCDKPSPPAESCPDFDGTYECDQLQLYKNMDQTWAICHVRI